MTKNSFVAEVTFKTYDWMSYIYLYLYLFTLIYIFESSKKGRVISK